MNFEKAGWFLIYSEKIYHMRMSFSVLLVFVFHLLSAQITIQYKKLAGVDPDLLSLDIYAPANTEGKAPVVFWVHGGGWAIGSKNYTTDSKAEFFTREGYLFVTVNYRLSPFPPDVDEAGRIKHPDHIIDIADAARWVYDSIANYGGDRNKMVAMGHSAGAHLVALLATNQKYLNRVQLPVTVFSGVVPIDTEGFDVERTINTGGFFLKKAYRNAFGDDPALWEDASPFKQIEQGEALPKHWLLFERGGEERVQQLQAFAQKLRTNGTNIEILDAHGLTHIAVNRRIGLFFDDVVSPAIAEFLQRVFN